MENEELLRRLRDLDARCAKSCDIVSSFFLTPAEQAAAESWAKFDAQSVFLLSGGRGECERKAAFFLPYYMEPESFDPSEHICLLRIKAGFGEPGHRDYLGAMLGLGIRREWLGDIWISGDTAFVFCLPSVEGLLLSSLEKVGRYGVKVSPAALSDAPAPVVEKKRVSFTVKSPRLDAAVSGMFGISRTQAAHSIGLGEVSLNYLTCLKPDAQVSPGDTVSLRGRGKGVIAESGGMSRKGRLFIEADIFK